MLCHHAVTSLRTFSFISVLSHSTSATSIFSNVSEPSLASLGETVAGQLANPRSLRTIIWTSLFTISIGAWISAAPNIPPRSPDERRVLYTKIMTTCVIILAPEFVGVWYLKQWMAARRITGKMRELAGTADWSQIHSHFLVMGGFTRVFNGRHEVLDEENLYELLRSSKVDLSTITNADILDKSKADALVRVTALGHVSWFIFRCLSRFEQRLATTHLELLALNFVFIFAIFQTCIFLKPICVMESQKVYLTSEITTVTNTSQAHDPDDFLSLADKVFEYLKLRSLIHLLRRTWRDRRVLNIVLLLPTCLLHLLFFLFTSFMFAFVSIIGPAPSKPQLASEAEPHNRFLILLKTYLPFPFRYLIRQCLRSTLSHHSALIHLFSWFVFLPTLLVILFPIQLCVFLLVAILLLVHTTIACISSMLEPDVVQPGATCFPVFYAPENPLIRIFFFPLFGFIFGGIHCIGWNFTYPTRVEQMLWRVASLFITFTPSVISSLHFVYTLGYPDRRRRLRRAVHMVEILLLCLYASARLSLIVQALVLLRELPQSIYRDADWSRYFPHF